MWLRMILARGSNGASRVPFSCNCHAVTTLTPPATRATRETVLYSHRAPVGCLLDVESALCSSNHVVRLRQGLLLQGSSVWHGNVGTTDTLDRCVQVVEGLCLPH